MRFSISFACAATGVELAFSRLTGRRECLSAEVGIASGIGSDMFSDGLKVLLLVETIDREQTKPERDLAILLQQFADS